MEENKKKVLADDGEIKCVADFLNILKKDVEELDSNKERFFRGLSKTKYIETDYPSIFRSPDNNPEYEPYIKYEHKMFYDLVSRFPEQFSSCKNTFEHLVMMQHYEFPTRLLDVTSNPLVALYFACVDRHGNVKDEDGIVTIYDIPTDQIKNYNSDTITILSNLARISEEYVPYYSVFNNILKNIKSAVNGGIDNYSIFGLEKLCDKLLLLVKEHRIWNLEQGFLGSRFRANDLNKKCNDILKSIERIKKTKETENEAVIKIKNNLMSFCKRILTITNELPYLSDLKFKHLIQEEKNHFIYENIEPTDLISFFCVKPKLNNPRIISQNGAFLLFGFADKSNTKNIPPQIHFEKIVKVNKNQNGIIITKENKINIYEELKQLGINRAFLFPEIDKVAQVVTNEYKIKK